MDFPLDDADQKPEGVEHPFELGTCQILVCRSHVRAQVLVHVNKDDKAGPNCKNVGLGMVDGQIHESAQGFIPELVKQLEGLVEWPQKSDSVVKENQHPREYGDDWGSVCFVHLASVGYVVYLAMPSHVRLILFFLKCHETLKG